MKNCKNSKVRKKLHNFIQRRNFKNKAKNIFHIQISLRPNSISYFFYNVLNLIVLFLPVFLLITQNLSLFQTKIVEGTILLRVRLLLEAFQVSDFQPQMKNLQKLPTSLTRTSSSLILKVAPSIIIHHI